MIIFTLLFLIAYTAGSINFTILLFKILNQEDPRNKFSGNAGATNAYRQAGKFWAVLILSLDAGRAVGIAILGLYLLKMELLPLIGFALVFGNRFPIFHQFRGGKGVANYLGFTAILDPLAAGLSAIIWVIVYGVIRVPFIASFFMILSLSAGTIIALNYNPVAILGSSITAILIFYNHKVNIKEYMKKCNISISRG